MATIRIKLAVDRSRNRMLFADAGSDFVDVLLSFLALPLSAVQFCAAGATSSPGCLSNLCHSVVNLRESKLLMADSCHRMLLTPSQEHEFGTYGSLCSYYDTFVKNQPNLQVDGDFCRCWLVLARLVYVYKSAISGIGRFVRGRERFVISDDLTIKPVSTSTMQLLPHNFIPDAILQEFEEMHGSLRRLGGGLKIQLILDKAITFSMRAFTFVVSILKASLSSHSIFTDVFLSKGTNDPAGRVTLKEKILHTSNKDSESDSSPKSNIKLFYDRKEKKVMYAECKREFVDVLLGFLSYPLGCVIKNMADGAVACPLGNGSFDNLYMSTIELEAAGFITDGYAEKMLLNPSLCPFSTQCFVLEETIHQASVMAVSKHWCRRDKANVVEMEITIGILEVVALLRAVLTSKTALTDVFINRLEEGTTCPDECDGRKEVSDRRG
ncbi:hypothetical protein VPH35_080185 [Triticum aestivum]